MSEVLTPKELQRTWEKKGWVFINPEFPSYFAEISLKEALDLISPREAEVKK